MSGFQNLPDSSFPELEGKIREQWKQQDSFKTSISNRKAKDAFIFYDGPPFATGVPHYGHLVASTLKDIVPRYWTMRGHRVDRRFGWDTHGVPIELLVEKKLNLSGPTSVREFGVAKFNETCRNNVLTYTEEWERVITKLGRWVDFENDYKTMDLPFMESVWWVFKELWNKGLIYQDFRVMPYSWRLSTSLSNFEAKSNYKDVQDPAISIAMPSTDGSNEVFVIWTTTPWTMPSNLAIAVGTDIDYVRATRPDDDRVFILAASRVKAILGKKATLIGDTFKGTELIGRKYEPPFPYFEGHKGAFRIITAPHVTDSDGAGLVHMAPDFGEEDFAACKKAGIAVVDSVDDEGNFRAMITDFAGRNVKEADSDLIKWMKDAGKLVRHDTLQHSYPFCWRSDTPLIYRALPAWFVNVTKIKDRMIEHNKTIHWVPETVGSKRFGNWLNGAMDWNISRNRFWGTPIPVWVCDQCGHTQALGSVQELQDLGGEEVTDLHPHRIDHLTWDCAECDGGTSRRISDVFDCWFESGSMPYAQNHYPFENKEEFEAGFPAQFIAEGLDQTRGWFYTLLVLSTALFDRPPFKNVVVNGMVLAEDGSKMSKSKQNYPPVHQVLDTYGADALRAYLINSPVVRAEPLKFTEEGVREVARTVLLPLRSAMNFFIQYANIDGWTPDKGLPNASSPAPADRCDLDRWLLSHSQSMIKTVHEQMELYQLYNVVPAIVGFIDDLTNWYIRRSRRRFWRSVDNAAAAADKAAAYATLHETFVSFSKILAPFLPFFSEVMYQTLVINAGIKGPDSVHLCDMPMVQPDLIDVELERAVKLSRVAVRLGRKVRERTKNKTRQPLASVTLVHHDDAVRARLVSQQQVIADELNVQAVVIDANGTDLATVICKPNFKRLGRRYGKDMKAVSQEISALTADQIRALESGTELEIFGKPVCFEDIVVRREPLPGTELETEDGLVVALDTNLTADLISAGVSREFISLVQRLRKAGGLQVTDRIEVSVLAEEAVLKALKANHELVLNEVLATTFQYSIGDGDLELPTVKSTFMIGCVVKKA